MKINSSAEFEALMSEIDAELREADVSIDARAIRGLGIVAKRLSTEIKCGPLSSGPIPGHFEGDSLSAHIIEWFNCRYGDRQKVDWSIGSTIYLLSGDPWLVSFPTIYGSVRLICEPDLSKEFSNLSVGKSGSEFNPPLLNVFKCIKDIPESNIRALTVHEHKSFMEFFVRSLRTFQSLKQLSKSNSLAKAARYDLSAAAQTCCGTRTDYEQSRWLSLQSAEKSLKLFISERGENFPHTHNLSSLASIALGLGMPKLEDSRIAEIQCSANVRYGGVNVSLSEAVKAQVSASSVATHVINALGNCT